MIAFPVQSIGFLLAGMGMMAMFIKKKEKKTAALAVAPVVYNGTFLFVGLMVAGLRCMDAPQGRTCRLSVGLGDK